MIRVVDATPEIADIAAADMRQADQDEVLALGMTPLVALHDGLRVSFIAHAGLDEDDKPIAIWGAQATGSLAGNRALLWFLSTNRLPKHKRQTAVWSRHFVQAMQDRYATLECVVDLRYDKAVRWVKWLGFEPHAQFSMGGTSFHLMQRRRD